VNVSTDECVNNTIYQKWNTL